MTKLKAFIISLVFSTAFTSCIYDDLQTCPSLQINLAVKDKNYSNVDQVEFEERLPEDMPFKEYIPTLYYRLSRLCDDGSKQLIEEKGVFSVEGEEQEYPIPIEGDLPFGKYIITVWGGIPNKDELNEDCTELSFHPDHTQGYDNYLASDTITYDFDHHQFTEEMRRTKGKLIILAEDLPRDIRFSGKTVDGLYGKVNTAFTYSDQTSVTTHQTRRGMDNILTETFLTPSIKKNGSLLDTNFYDDNDFTHPEITPKDVNITMRRNELTVLKYVYDAQDQQFYIYILVNNNWERIHDMILD